MFAFDYPISNIMLQYICFFFLFKKNANIVDKSHIALPCVHVIQSCRLQREFSHQSSKSNFNLTPHRCSPAAFITTTSAPPHFRCTIFNAISTEKMSYSTHEEVYPGASCFVRLQSSKHTHTFTHHNMCTRFACNVSASHNLPT